MPPPHRPSQNLISIGRDRTETHFRIRLLLNRAAPYIPRQVGWLCGAPDENVRQSRDRPLGEGRYVWVGALYEEVGLDERAESIAVVIATGVNAQGGHGVLRVDVIPIMSEVGWTALLKSQKERG